MERLRVANEQDIDFLNNVFTVLFLENRLKIDV